MTGAGGAQETMTEGKTENLGRSQKKALLSQCEPGSAEQHYPGMR